MKRLLLLPFALAATLACDATDAWHGDWNLTAYELVVLENGAEVHRTTAEDAGYLRFEGIHDVYAPQDVDWDHGFTLRRPDVIRTRAGWSAVPEDAWGMYKVSDGELRLAFRYDEAQYETLVFDERSGGHAVAHSEQTQLVGPTTTQWLRTYTLDREAE